MKRLKNKELTDWVAIYQEIQCFGITDPIFHWDSFFNCLPIEIIVNQLKVCVRKEKRDAVFSSITTARIGAGFSENTSYQDFLPFDLEEKFKLSNETFSIIRALIKNKLLPDAIVSALSKYMEQILDCKVNE